MKKIHKEYKIDIDAEIKELNRKIYMSKLTLESRNIPEFLLENNRVLFYKPKSKIKLKAAIPAITALIPMLNGLEPA